MAKTIVASRKEAGREIAPHLIEPKYPEHCGHVVQAFKRLNADRPIGMAVGPIPWSSMYRYAGYLGLSRRAFHSFMYLLEEMDNEYMAVRQEQSEVKRGGSDG